MPWPWGAECLRLRNVQGLRCYHAQAHGALFALPGYFRDPLDAG